MTYLAQTLTIPLDDELVIEPPYPGALLVSSQARIFRPLKSEPALDPFVVYVLLWKKPEAGA